MYRLIGEGQNWSCGGYWMFRLHPSRNHNSDGFNIFLNVSPSYPGLYTHTTVLALHYDVKGLACVVTEI